MAGKTKEAQDERTSKITVIALDRHVAYLDRLAIDIRLKRHAVLNRTEIVRGLIEAMFQSGIDLSDADSEEALRKMLSERWQGSTS